MMMMKGHPWHLAFWKKAGKEAGDLGETAVGEDDKVVRKNAGEEKSSFDDGEVRDQELEATAEAELKSSSEATQ